jgi:hypothetical protein
MQGTISKKKKKTKKKPTVNGLRGVAQVVKSLLCKHEALNSNPGPLKKKKK